MAWGLAVMVVLMRLLYLSLYRICSLIDRKKVKGVPPIQNPLLQISATTLAKKIREGEISSQTVVETYIARIKEVNPFLNAVTEDRFEEAVADAKACDQKLKFGEVTSQMLEKEKPLFGVPVTVKESCALKGLSYTAGSLLRKGIKAEEDCFPVEAIKKAGAIPLCVTNVPEMCTSFQTSNFVYGETFNPHDKRYASGGSSGGEGVLLGVGASLIGIGSDIAGSIRIPAHYNGTFGHKPTSGIISIKGHHPYSDNEDFQAYLVLGPLTRYAEDLHLAMKVLASKCEHNLRLDEPIYLKKLRVYYTDNIGSTYYARPASEVVKQCIKKAVDYLNESCALVEQLSPNYLVDLFPMTISTFFDMEFPDLLADPNNPTATKNPASEVIKSMFGLSKFTRGNALAALLTSKHGFISQAKRKECRKLMAEARQKFIDLLKEDGIIIWPTWPDTFPLKVFTTLEWPAGMYCAIVNVFGFPSTHVPMGLDKDGMPTGFQVIAGSHQDRLCLAVAKELEKKFGGWIPPPTL